jgi:hypothetical protein
MDTGDDLLNFLVILGVLVILTVIYFLFISVIKKFRYHPKLNHLGIVLRDENHPVLVNPDQTIFLNAFGDKVDCEIDLAEHNLQATYRNLILEDNTRVSCQLWVGYRVDLRLLGNQEHLVELAHRSETEWRACINRYLEHIVRNEVFSTRQNNQIFHDVEREAIRFEINERLTQHMALHGVSIDENLGVLLLNLQPEA